MAAVPRARALRVLLVVAAAAPGCSLLEGNDAGKNAVGGSATASGSESGRLVGITAAHNRVRASVDANPPLPDLEWSEDLAKIAQRYAEKLAPSCDLVHSGGDYGENLAFFGGQAATADGVVQLWADEGECWTFGAFMRGDSCSDACEGACGHYTQIVWRSTEVVGCGVASCAGGGDREIWVCNYDPPGNFIGEPPY